jgi:phosphoserine phosphatase RsbU/P
LQTEEMPQMPRSSSVKKQSNKSPGLLPAPPDNNFPTIGLLTEGLTGQYQAGAWPGIVDAARLHNVNILCFCGGSLSVSAENPWDYQGNVLYKIARTYPLDGMIIAGSVGCYATDSAFNEFLYGFRHLKIITIAPAAESLPAVFVDNRSGMRDLVTHLVSCHPCRKIAFVKGPDRNIEAESRFTVFKEVMAQHNVPVDPRRVLQGDFTRHCGAAAVERLVSSDTEFDAIVASNDDTAIGAIGELRARGMRVPEDVAVVGFDDVDESGLITPPLTTVRQPLYELGKLAVEKLLMLLKGEEIPRNNIVDAKLVIRQSCGCFQTDMNGASRLSRPSPVRLSSGLVEKEVVSCCADAVDRVYKNEVKEVVTAFCTDVNNGTDAVFLRTVDRVGHSIVPQDRIFSLWMTVFHRLWQFAASHLEQPALASSGDLLHRAIALCGDRAAREQGIRRIQANKRSVFLREIGDALNNSLNIDKLMDAIHDYFPRAGIHTFYLSLYERTDAAPAGKSRLKYALVNNRRKALDKDGIEFATMSLIPPGTVSGKAVHVLVAEALYFQKEAFGMAIFEAGPEDRECGHYHILKEYISGALHTAALIRKVQRQAEVLAKANTELVKLREEEHAYLQAIKRELDLGRKIQMGFLPHKLPQVPGWEIAAAFEPAREVSGDFYDAFMLDESHVALVIADVSGKDVSAALFMSLIRTLIRVFAERAGKNGDDPLDAVKVVNDYILRHHFPGDAHGSMFATILFGILRPDDGEFRYINAGHIAPMITNKKGEISVLAPTSMAVGLAAGCSFEQETFTINRGDLVFMYTDGVTEAKNPGGDFFTKERLKSLLGDRGATAAEVIDLISTTLRDHCGGAAPYDDITMLAVKRE